MSKSLVSASIVLALAGMAAAQNRGPSTLVDPYVIPSRAGVSTTSILTVGENIGGYRLVGIPDGMGVFDAGDGNMTVLVNHELGQTSGTVRAHGQTGAIVSRWNITPGSLVVNSGRDHNAAPSDAYEYVGAGVWSNVPSPTQRWGRFCSADLAAPGAYAYTDATGATFGTTARIYMNGEEIGAEGRAYAHIVSGASVNQTWQLPHLGKYSWENSVASPTAQSKTIVMGLDDASTNGQVYMYVGTKTQSGNDIERAGLTNGSVYGVRVQGVSQEQRATPANGRFEMYNHGNVAERSGASLNTESRNNNVTSFLRPEDGAWDPRPGYESDFYFLTTDRFNQPGQVGNSRLYRLRFDDISNPELGGEITELVSTATDGAQMMDNMCIDSLGRILIQEDVGNNDRLGKIWLYDIASDGFVEVAAHDAKFFSAGGSDFLTRDEESSGIIDAKDFLGLGWFLLDVQAHYGIPGELVEGGQLLAMYVDPAIPAPGAAALLGWGGLVASRRRRA